MNEIYCSKEIKIAVEKILNQYDTSVFIFYGQEGIGKRSFTNALSNKILQIKNKCDYFSVEPLINFENIQQKNENLILNNTHPDLFILEQHDDKSISIDNVRELKLFLNQTRSISKNKVIIIDPVENLTINATNTLLKSLEETNHNTYIFLISHNLENVLKTIQSRVFKFYFNPISKEHFISLLSQIKKYNFNNDELILINNMFNYSPGKFLQFYFEENKLLDDYKIFILNLKNKTLFNQKLQKNFFVSHNLKILFLNNFIKNIITFFLSGDFNNFTIGYEKEIIKNLNLNSVLINRIYTEYSLFQSLLRDTLIYNSNVDDLLEIFINKIDL